MRRLNKPSLVHSISRYIECISLLLLIGCSEDEPSIASFKEKLYGKWQYIYTDGRLGRTTAASQNINNCLEFDRRGRVYYYDDDTVSSSGIFSVTWIKSNTEGLVEAFDTIDTTMPITIGYEYEIIGDSLFERPYDIYDVWWTSAYYRIH